MNNYLMIGRLIAISNGFNSKIRQIQIRVLNRLVIRSNLYEIIGLNW